MSDTYTDIQIAKQEHNFGGFHVDALEQYTPTQDLNTVAGLEILERLGAETHSTSHAADLRYLHRLIMSLDSDYTPF